MRIGSLVRDARYMGATVTNLQLDLGRNGSKGSENRGF
jgi:hypothetical protein